MRRGLQCLMGMALVVFGLHPGALANPKDYPEFAQQKVEETIPIAFVKAATVKQRLDEKAPQLIVDVRDSSSYDSAHLPNAVSIPLRQLPHRAAEIPRDVPVVLY